MFHNHFTYSKERNSQDQSHNPRHFSSHEERKDNKQWMHMQRPTHYLW